MSHRPSIGGTNLPPTRVRGLAAGLALAVIAVSGCGGGHQRQAPTASPSAPASTPASTATTPAPVSYSASHVRSALLTAHDIGSGTRGAPLTVFGLSRTAVPSCADMSIHVPGRPDTTAHEFDPVDPRSSAPTYVQFTAVYPDASSAASAFARIRSTVSACPAGQRVPAKKLSGNRVKLAYEERWKTTTDDVLGWSRVRGFEKLTYSPSASIINVIYKVHDYAVRGNTLLMTVYIQRVAPSAAEDPVATKATALLTKQLSKIG